MEMFDELLLPISAQETIHRQAVVCHRVLRRVQELAHQSQVGSMFSAS